MYSAIVEESVDVNYIQLIDSVVEFNSIFTDFFFLPAGSVHF